MNALDGLRLPALRLLWWAVWGELLLTRFFSRIGIYIPKSGMALEVYHAVLSVGEFAFNLSLLLGAALLLWVVVEKRHWAGAATVVVAGQLALLVPGEAASASWSALTAASLMVAVLVLGVSAMRAAEDRWERGALALAVAVHLLAYAVAETQLVWSLLELPGAAPLLGEAQRVGELLAMVIPVLLGVRLLGRFRGRALWAGLAAAAGLGAAYWVNPDITAILAMYTLGFGLSWPAPVYLIAVAAGVPALVQLVRDRPERGLALGLLFLAGYSPQMNQQHVLVLVGWALLARPLVPREEEPRYVLV